MHSASEFPMRLTSSEELLAMRLDSAGLGQRSMPGAASPEKTEGISGGALFEEPWLTLHVASALARLEACWSHGLSRFRACLALRFPPRKLRHYGQISTRCGTLSSTSRQASVMSLPDHGIGLGVGDTF